MKVFICLPQHIVYGSPCLLWMPMSDFSISPRTVLAIGPYVNGDSNIRPGNGPKTIRSTFSTTHTMTPVFLLFTTLVRATRNRSGITFKSNPKSTLINVPKNLYFHIPMTQHTNILIYSYTHILRFQFAHRPTNIEYTNMILYTG